MKRPLFFGCICLIALIAIWTCYFDAPPFYGDVPVKEGEHIIITGQVYQKEYRSYYGTDKTNLYLKSITIIDSDTGQVSDLNPKYKIICELNREQKEPELGRSLRMSGTWQLYEHASNPGEFDLADYYATEGIVGKLANARIEAQGERFWPLRKQLYHLRTLLKDRLYAALPQKEASILAKMLLGEKSGLDEGVKDLYQRNGIVHILSISGLHITMIGMGVYRMLRKGSCPVVPAALVGVAFLLLYGTMTGFGISSYRAIGMYLIHMLGEISGRSYDLLTATSILMAVMVCDNPRLIYHCGFLLSFGSVCAIGCLCPILPLQDVFAKKRAIPLSSPIRFVLKRFGGILQGLWVSTAISVFTLPIMLYFFYEIPVYSPFVNLLVLPFMGMVMTMGFVLMVVPRMPLLAKLEHIILNGYERVCLLFEELPGHTWLVGRPQLWQIGVYYAGLLLIIWLCRKKNRRGNISDSISKNNLGGSGHLGIKNMKIGFRKSKWWACGIIVLVLFLGTDFQKRDTISFLAVGQGDCIVVMTKTGKTYLFDGGSSSERSVGEDIIQPFLKYHGVSRLDGVFLSHPDQDHINGVMELLEKELLEIESIYLPDVDEEGKKDFQEILNKVTKQRVVYYSTGDYLQEGKLLITCLHPPEDFAGETNVYSGCFLLEGGGLKVLLTGDVEAVGEVLLARQLQDRGIGAVQVLKIAHHGSRYSTGKEFLGAVSARLAVISCGAGNSYGHPHEETLEKLDAKGIPYCITWKNGCVTVAENGYCFFKR